MQCNFQTPFGCGVEIVTSLKHRATPFPGGTSFEAVLETAVRRNADLVLIQEPRGEKEKDSTRSHPNFNFIRGEESMPAKCWIAVFFFCLLILAYDLYRSWRDAG